MKKNILLPTDFSRNAYNAALYARELYKNETCDFYLMNAFSSTYVALGDMDVPVTGTKFYESAKEIAEDGLNKSLEQLLLKPRYDHHSYYTLSCFDDPLNAIKAVVDQKDIEVIVMGSKGSQDNASNVYGSTTISVMEKARNCPVLAIPGDVLYKEPKEIVFPTNYKTYFKRRELQYMYEIAKITNASIRILHVKEDISLDEEQKNNKVLLENCLDGLEFTYHELDNTKVLEGLKNFVESRGSDMIAFINKKHVFFNLIFSKPMVKDLGHDSRVPVLVMHDLKN
jgi:nucleotide-binding universal stress UspA family protein